MQKFNEPRTAVVEFLVATGKWSIEQAKLGEQTGYCCEYCGLDFLESVTNYKLWAREHIVPVKHYDTDDYDNPENLTIACSVCNKIKGTYNPRDRFPQENPTRSQLIGAARDYIRDQIKCTVEEIEQVREIVGYVSENTATPK